MARKQTIGNIISAGLGLFMGSVAFYVSWHWLAQPDTLLEWTVQICSGLTVGIVVFFMAWGHFQDPPKVGQG